MSEVWTQWEGHVIDGTFPLERLLGASDHSGVFLTRTRSGQDSKAALKLVPALPSLVEAQLSHWRSAIELRHPRLVRLHESGRCQLGEGHFLFLLMEYADQTLAEVLPHRALTADEAREMLIPTLDALSFLHGQKLVQGRVKPTNILVVGDQLKLASDTIRPASEATANIATPSVYDAPETQGEIFTTAVDVWGLGVTLAEALTQRPPAKGSHEVELPADFPPTFAEPVRRCLSYTAANRPDVAALMSWVGGNANAPAERAAPPPRQVADPERFAPSLLIDAPMEARPSERMRPATRTPPQTASAEAPLERSGKRRSIPAALGVVAIGVIAWAAVHLAPEQPGSQPPPVNASWAAPTQDSQQDGEGARPESGREQPPSAPAESSEAARDSSPRTSAGGSRASASGVLHEEIPKPSKSARDTIHGHIKVAVRVTVDKSGAVVSDSLDDPGPSHYFARLSSQAARKWKFAPADDQRARVWLVRFEFGREGTTAHAVGPRSR